MSVVLCCVCLASVLLELIDAKAVLCIESFQHQVLEQPSGAYRLWTHQLFAGSSAAVLLLVVLFAQFRGVERQLGSRRYAAFVLLTAAGAPLGIVSAAVLSVDPFAGVVAGPVSVVFGLLVLHVRLSPLDGTALLAAHMLLITGVNVILHAAVGIGFGMLYFHRRSLLPVAVAKFLVKR